MSQGKNDYRYCFVVDWFDPAASLVRKYQLIYYAADGTIEMVSSDAPSATHAPVPLTLRATALTRSLTPTCSMILKTAAPS